MTNNFVYLLRSHKTGLVKIGQSNNPERRRRDLQDEYGDLEIIGTLSDHSLERELHERFAEYREHGEWFHPGPRLHNFLILNRDRPDLWGDNPFPSRLEWTFYGMGIGFGLAVGYTLSNLIR